jgi:hypothetical protein
MAELSDILKVMETATERFSGRIPTIQEGVLEDLYTELKGLDLNGKSIANTVKNIRLIAKVKAKLQKLIITDDYKKALKEYMKVFDSVTKIQNEYFQEAEASKSAFKLGKALKEQTISDTIDKLTERGIGVNVGDKVQDILRTNITTGGSYKSLTDQLNESLSQTGTKGLLQRYTGGVVVDAVNQYSAQYMQNLTSDLGYEWYRYQGRDIDTTRHFCDAMTDREYFHISEVPDLLKAKDLYYVDKDGKEKKVEIYDRTGLPQGMIEGTDVSNFFVRRGGYNCGHQIFPVAESRVPQEHKDRVFASAAYKQWASLRK